MVFVIVVCLRACLGFHVESKAGKFNFVQGGFCSRMRAIRRKIQRRTALNLSLAAQQWKPRQALRTNVRYFVHLK